MNESKAEELNLLEQVTNTYVTSESPQDRLIKSLAVRVFEPYLTRTGRALEFGCCDGFMTSKLAYFIEDITVVDGSKTFIRTAKKRVPSRVKFVHSLFEDYASDEKYDFIFATYVLEHVQNAVDFLKKARDFLTDHGILFIVVPNARAFSRQLARHMGLIDELFSLTQNDINHGHRRVYDRVLLNRDIELAGLSQITQGGLLLKILADFQMDEMIEKNIIGKSQQEGLFKMGLEYPDMAGSIFSICTKSKP